jgi:N utilization substance protein B
MTESTPSTPASRPPRQPRKGVTSTGARKMASKSPRSRSREFALQGLYQVLVGKNDVAEVDPFTRELAGFSKAEPNHFQALLHGCAQAAPELDELIQPLLDRSLELLSPIEHAILWMGAYELQQCPEVPWRVVLDEYIELTKEFGGTDGHKYVNGVLNHLADRLRPDEVRNDPAARR